jgi:hypothetical protein
MMEIKLDAEAAASIASAAIFDSLTQEALEDGIVTSMVTSSAKALGDRILKGSGY